MTKTPLTAVLLAAGFALAAGPAFGQDSNAQSTPSVVVPLTPVADQPASEPPAEEPVAQAQPAEQPAAQAAEEDAGGQVIAVVNGAKLYEADLMAFVQQLPPQLQAQAQLLMPQIIDQLVNNELSSQAGRAADLGSDAEVRERLDKIEHLIIGQTYLERAVDDRVTDAALDEAYQRFLAENPPERELTARHILVKTEEEAKEVITALDGGADFAELAKERSTGPSGAQGGELPPFKAGDMVPEFSDAAFAMEVGTHSKAPVKTQFGWHVIKLEDSTMTEPPAKEEVEQQLRGQLQQQAVSAVYDELRHGAEIEVLIGRPQAEEAPGAQEPAPGQPAPGQPAPNEAPANN